MGEGRIHVAWRGGAGRGRDKEVEGMGESDSSAETPLGKRKHETD